MAEVSEDGRTPAEDGRVLQRTTAWYMDGLVRGAVELAYLFLAHGHTPAEAIARTFVLTRVDDDDRDLLRPEELGPLSVSQATALALTRHRARFAEFGIGELPDDPLDPEEEDQR